MSYFAQTLTRQQVTTLTIITSIIRALKNGKYVVGRQIFVDRRLVDRLLSKNFRRHDTSSTSILSKFFRRHKHAEVEELLRVLNFFKFQTIQLLYLESEGEGDNYKTTSDKVRVKAKIFKLDHTK